VTQRTLPPTIRSLLRRGGNLLHRLSAEAPAPSTAGRILPTAWSWTQVTGLGSFREVDAAHSIYRHPPRGAEPTLHWKFLGELHRVSPATFVAEIPAGRVTGPSGAVFTSTGHLLADVSVELGRSPLEHSALTHDPALSTRESGTVVALTAAGGESYFHWLFDVLPRLGVLRRSGVPLSEADRYLVNTVRAPFQAETLEALGIPVSRVLGSDTTPDLTAERLVVPSLPGMSGNPPGWACQFLRSSFLPGVQDRPAARIYVSRASAGSRRVLNEPEILPVLERAGFEKVELERLPFAAQVELFANAEAVVAPHGAGLSNLVFSRPGTRVVELFSPAYVNVCYWALGEQVGAEYRYLLGEGAAPPEFVDPHHAHADLVVDPKRLERALTAALGEAALPGRGGVEGPLLAPGRRSPHAAGDGEGPAIP
jgi:capsular polysaccharide biosynthesis protein